MSGKALPPSITCVVLSRPRRSQRQHPPAQLWNSRFQSCGVIFGPKNSSWVPCSVALPRVLVIRASSFVVRSLLFNRNGHSSVRCSQCVQQSSTKHGKQENDGGQVVPPLSKPKVTRYDKHIPPPRQINNSACSSMPHTCTGFPQPLLAPVKWNPNTRSIRGASSETLVGLMLIATRSSKTRFDHKS